MSSSFIACGRIIAKEPIWDLWECLRSCIRSRGSVAVLHVTVADCLDLLSVPHLLALHLLVEDHLHHILDLLKISM